MENASWQAIREQARLDSQSGTRFRPAKFLLFGAALATGGLLALQMTAPVPTASVSSPTARVAMPVVGAMK